MLPMFDPIALGLYFVGYIFMFVVAATVAPRVAKSVSGASRSTAPWRSPQC